MSIHVCTFFSPFAQSRHILSLSPECGDAPRQKSRVCVCVPKTSKIIRGRKKLPSAAFFETARVESIDRSESPIPAQSSPETRFGV